MTTSHFSKAFPLVPSGHEQSGIWFTVSHSAPVPQVPWHGSRQWDLIQARFGEQSESATHSGLQPVYGSPCRFASHSQDALAPRDRQIAPGPHGDGLHGSFGIFAVKSSINILLKLSWLYEEANNASSFA